MFKPALVIGLGGTGVLALRHLKGELLGSEQRQMPPHIKLVAFDTVSEQGRSAAEEKNIANVLRTELDTGEYFAIGGDVFDFAREVAQGQHPQVGSWFQARTYLNLLPRAIFNLQHGAGQLRQFGRLAIFKDVASPNLSEIYLKLKTRIDEIRRAQGFIGSLDVFLVSSVAGGTGAGMFVDIAYLVRKIAEVDAGKLPVRLRGFLVLPEAFQAIPGGVKDVMRARSFAAMRENRRFMVDFTWDIGYPMYYHAKGDKGIWHDEMIGKLFDFMYHIDGQRTNQPLTNVPPELGVTAAIADAIAGMLDQDQQTSEDRYQRHATNVMAQIGQSQSELGHTAFDSAIGTYTIILPMHHIMEELSYRLAQEGMEILLAPSKRDNDKYPTELAPDRNAEAGSGTRGRQGAVTFLKAAEVQQLRGTEKVAGTQLGKEILRVWQNYSPQNPGLIQELAARDVKAWEIHVDPPGDTPEFRAARNRALQVLNSTLIAAVPPSSGGEKGPEALLRIFPGVDQFKSLYLGREDARTGQRQGGQYRSALDEYGDIHLSRFRLMLQIEVNNILNGSVGATEVEAKGAKLGYLLDFVEGLEEIFSAFIKALNDAKALREKQGTRSSAIASVQAAKRELEAKPNGMFGPATDRQKHYLEAEQRLINVYKNDIIETMVRDTALKMLEHTQALKKDLQGWIETLAIGYDSLYARLARGRGQIASLVAAENQVRVREIVWDAGYMDELYQRYAHDLTNGLEDFLKTLDWQLAYQRVGAREEYKLTLTVQNGAKNTLGMKSQERNLELLLTPARKIFADAWAQESVVKYLMNRKYPAPDDLARELAAFGGPLLGYDGGNVVPANYLHVAHGADPNERTYIDRVKAQLLNLSQARGLLNDVINSSDRFRCRLVYTLDLVPLDQIRSYKNSIDKYRSYVQDVGDQMDGKGQLGRETLHVFPAEVHAAQFERRLVEIDQPPREFHNDVVLQLEDLERFRLFARSWAFGVINRATDEKAGSYWAIDLPGDAAPELGGLVKPKPIHIFLTTPITGQSADIFEALKTFNYVRKDVRPDYRKDISYLKVQAALDAARTLRVQDFIDKGGLDADTLTKQRIESLSVNRDHIRRRFAEGRYLQRLQEELQPKLSDTSNERVRDINILFYLVLADDVHTINEEYLEATKSR